MHQPISHDFPLVFTRCIVIRHVEKDVFSDADANTLCVICFADPLGCYRISAGRCTFQCKILCNLLSKIQRSVLVIVAQSIEPCGFSEFGLNGTIIIGFHFGISDISLAAKVFRAKGIIFLCVLLENSREAQQSLCFRRDGKPFVLFSILGNGRANSLFNGGSLYALIDHICNNRLIRIVVPIRKRRHEDLVDFTAAPCNCDVVQGLLHFILELPVASFYEEALRNTKHVALLSERDFEPDSDFYFCENLVESYNKIVVTINKTALPYRRARINRIVFGRERKFGMTELRSVGITNEMDLSSIELPVSVMDWGLESKEPVVFMFQFKQPVECLQDDRLIGVYYVDDHKRLSSGRYTINCVDALGILEESPFPGGVYADKSAKTILEEIADGDFQFLFEVDDVSLTGAILSTTKREAIQQVLFAAGWCLSTDGRYDLRVFEPTEAPYSIGMDRTFPGVSVETSAIVTAVTVVSHAYTQDSSGSVEINGVKYSDTQTEHTVVNTDVTVNTKKNIKTVRGATLVSPDIGQAVAQRLYDYYSRRNALSAKFVWQGERLGDCVTQPIPWGTEETGHIVRMDIRLSNTVVADGRSLGA